MNTPGDITKLPPRRKLFPPFLSTLTKSPVGLTGTLIVSMIVLLAIIGPVISPHDPMDRNLRARYKAPGYAT